MASELSWRHTRTGATVYATIRTTARQMWNGSALEALTVANWGNYDIALAESPASSYFYVGDWPGALSTVGWYYVDVYEQAGASPAISDALIGTILGYWNGTTFSPSASNMVQCGGSAVAAGAIPNAAADAAGGLPISDDGGLDMDAMAASVAAIDDSETAYQESAKIIHRTKGTVWFVSTTGDDGNSGLTPTQAKQSLKAVAEAATAGDVVVALGGEHDLGVAGIAQVDGTALVGAGIGRTVIKSALVPVESGDLGSRRGCILRPGSDSYIGNFSLIGTAADGDYQLPLGAYSAGQDAAFTNAMVENVYIEADTDAIFIFHGTPCSMRLHNVVTRTKYDAYMISGDAQHQVDAVDCVHVVRGPSLADGDAGECRGVVVWGGVNAGPHVTLANCVVDVQTTEATAVTTFGVGSVSTFAHDRLDVSGGTIIARAPAGTVASVSNAGTGRVVLSGVDYDRSTTSGTIIEISSAESAIVNSNLDHLVKTPTAASDMTTECPDNTILARLIANGDTSTFVQATDGLKPTRTRLDTVTAGGPTLAELTARSLPSAEIATAAAQTTMDGKLDGIEETQSDIGEMITDLETHGDSSWATATSVTVSDKTGFKLASDGLAAVTSWTVGITGNITGNLSGSVGSVTTVTDKTGYALAASQHVIVDSGTVTSVTNAVSATVAGMATEAKQDTAQGTLTKMESALEADGDAWKFTGSALQESPVLTYTAQDIAEAIAVMDMSSVESTAAPWSLCTYVLAKFSAAWSGATLTIYRSDGETVHATATVSTDTYGRVDSVTELTAAP